MKRNIFTKNAPQFFGCPNWMTEDNITEMRKSFESQKLGVSDIEKALGENPEEYLSFDYDSVNWLNCAQFTVRSFSEIDDYLIVDFVGTVG